MMKIIDIVHVVGRGYIFIGQPDAAIHIGDKMRYNNQEFIIRGIEMTHISKNVGLVLSHSEAAYEAILIGDEVEIINKPCQGTGPWHNETMEDLERIEGEMKLIRVE